MNDRHCVVCHRKVLRTDNYCRCHLWGTFATFHWRCLAHYLSAKAPAQVAEQPAQAVRPNDAN